MRSAADLLRVVKELAVEHAGRHRNDHHGESALKIAVENLVDETHESTSFLDLSRSLDYTT